jgi:hypothetical protein
VRLWAETSKGSAKTALATILASLKETVKVFTVQSPRLAL